MSKKKKRGASALQRANQQPQKARSAVLLNTADFMEMIRCGEYVSLADNPEIMTACGLIADLVSNMTIYLMSNTEKGDVRIKNELSRKLDINPNKYMTRKSFIFAVVMNLLLHGSGNSVVYPQFDGKLLGDLHPVDPARVSFIPDGWGYRIMIDGAEISSDDLLHFTYNPDPHYPWKGRGVTTTLRDVAKNLKQASATQQGFMESKWKPSLIVKVDAIGDEFSDPAKRRTILDDYVSTSEAGEPWILPAEQFTVEQIKPLSLNDLALKDTVELDKKTVASIVGVPPFMLGVGSFNEKEWNNFINSKVMGICKIIEQEFTKKLILSEKWYWKFNLTSLYAYDLNTISRVYLEWYRSGLMDGNEARDKMSMPPREGLDQLVVLENYIPVDKIGDQKKLNGGEEDAE